MNDVLTDLYFGRISPWEEPPPHDRERREVDRQIEDEKRYFLQKMSLDDCNRLQALETLYTQSATIGQVAAFSCGFQLAAKLMAAVFTESG